MQEREILIASEREYLDYVLTTRYAERKDYLTTAGLELPFEFPVEAFPYALNKLSES